MKGLECDGVHRSLPTFQGPVVASLLRSGEPGRQVSSFCLGMQAGSHRVTATAGHSRVIPSPRPIDVWGPALWVHSAEIAFGLSGKSLTITHDYVAVYDFFSIPAGQVRIVTTTLRTRRGTLLVEFHFAPEYLVVCLGRSSAVLRQLR